jgi:hypothetical protein
MEVQTVPRAEGLCMPWIAGCIWDAHFEALDDAIGELERQEKARGRRNGR